MPDPNQKPNVVSMMDEQQKGQGLDLDALRQKLTKEASESQAAHAEDLKPDPDDFRADLPNPRETLESTFIEGIKGLIAIAEELNLSEFPKIRGKLQGALELFHKG